jgi:thiol-disulfide isomerase/thioredoxin
MVKKNPDITIILTKMSWCGHCKDFQEIFDNIDSRIKENKLLKDKEVVLETYDMEQKEAEFSKKYPDYMSKIDGYPTVFIFVKNNKNKIQGDTIEHTVIDSSSKKDMSQLKDDATDEFLSKIESKYKSVTNGIGEEYVQVQGGGGINKCILDGGSKNYEYKYKKYKIKYLELINKYNKIY